MQAQVFPIFIVSAWLVSPTAFSQPVERVQDLKPFTTLEVKGCFDTKLVPGSTNRLTVSATAEQHEQIRIEQDGETVTVGLTERGDFWSGGCRGAAIKVLVSANFAKDGPVDLRLHGSGDLDAEVPAAGTLSASVAGSGDLTLRGSAGACKITIAGSGDVDLATVEELAVAIHGSGDVSYRGEPRLRRMQIHGSGELRQL